MHLVYQKLMALDYGAQVELVRDLREKDADFVDTLNVSTITKTTYVYMQGDCTCRRVPESFAWHTVMKCIIGFVLVTLV